MKRLIFLIAFFIVSLPVFGQGHIIYSDEDPAFNYIQTYLPEYYYEEDFVGGNRNAVEFSVRTLYNYLDDKTFSYFILTHETDWGCFDIDEIDSIITYLEQASDKSSFPSTSATVVYNTRRGFMFESRLQFNSPVITLFFPKNGPKCETRNATNWIKALTKGKEYVKYDTQFVSWTDTPDEGRGYFAAKAIARVRFRYVVGGLPKPKSVGNGIGRVVVQVKVDQYGNVIAAIPGVDGTTLEDKEQWKEACSAALKTHFNMSAHAPESQTGTITYSFDGSSDE